MTVYRASDPGVGTAIPECVEANIRLKENKHLLDCPHRTSFRLDFNINLIHLPNIHLGWWCSFDHNVIESLSLPGLGSLSATVLSSDLFAFLKRSSPPLLELVLGHEHDFLPLVECLRLAPQLRRFEMWEPHCPVVESLFAALVESPSLLPQLSTLVIRFNQDESDAIFDSFWTVALRAFVARRARFQVLHLGVPKSLHDSKMPPPHIVAQFRELALDGVQIHLGALYETWTHTFS
ncbi:hypothetical protein DFH08DRAFT_826938 [Mycena albidolilacea]|uniref:Uncharacterized protein n=1 Tax=Mycena albidolilacea TaxID=1033008 RepID=A0AAD7E7S3_9AGAR|nr:hypothetical protein DFH08DRAFT_826938 [Mycena albidolilacea]